MLSAEDKKSLRENTVHTEDKLTVTPDEMNVLKNWVKMAEGKRDTEFTPVASALREKYLGLDRSDDDNVVTVNVMYSNIENLKPSVFFQNPKIFVKPTQDTFVLENGEKIDGIRASRLLEDAANYVAYSGKIVRVIKDVRDDALILSYGVGMIGYESETGINEEGKDFIREESIFVSRVSPFNFLVDPEAKDCREFKDARWVGQEVYLRYSDFMEDDFYENKDDFSVTTVGFNQNMISGKGKSKKFQSVMDFADADFKDNPDAKRIKLYRLWIRPSIAEKKKLKKGEPGGKIVIFSMESDKPHKVLRWTHKIKGFPYFGLAFVKDNSSFYPVSDVMQYEQQINELSDLRTAQLDLAKRNSKPKTFINGQFFTSEESKNALNDPYQDIVMLDSVPPGTDIRSIIWSPPPPSVPGDFYAVDRKVVDDIGEMSGMTDIRKGAVQAGIDTATEARIANAGVSIRLVEKKEQMKNFFEDIARAIVQLVKQYWTTETMVRRLGTLQPEWTDNFSADDIQIEDDVDVDIGEMVPTDEIVRKKQSLDLIKLITDIVSNPVLNQQLKLEGININFGEVMKEALQSFNVQNEKIVEKMGEQKFMQVLQQMMQQDPQRFAGIMQQLMQMAQQQQMQGGQQGGGGQQRQGTNLFKGSQGTPNSANETAAATRGANGRTENERALGGAPTL